jgi:speckle-type POZ protein
MSLDDVNALPKGFLVNDTLAVEVQIHVITVVKEFS